MAEPGVAPAAWDSQSSPRDASCSRPALLRGSAFNGWTREWNESGGSRHGHVGARSPGPSPEARPRGEKPPQWSAGRRSVPVTRHAAPPQGARPRRSAFPALRSLTWVREGRGRRPPRRPKNGDDESRLLECACVMHAGCLTSESMCNRRQSKRQSRRLPFGSVCQLPRRAPKASRYGAYPQAVLGIGNAPRIGCASCSVSAGRARVPA